MSPLLRLWKATEVVACFVLIGMAAWVWYRHTHGEPFPEITLWTVSGAAIGGGLYLAGAAMKSRTDRNA